MENRGKADQVIQQAGCGLFQSLLVVLVNILPKFGAMYTMLFMSFANYNPGWRCLDNAPPSYVFNHTLGISESFATNQLEKEEENSGELTIGHFIVDNKTSNMYKEESCDLFKTCQNVEFDPDTSTIVTEWGLICDESWVPSLIISVQMAGVLAGSLISGQLGDVFGRKKLLYIPLALAGILCCLAIYSPNWKVFITIRFFIGANVACMYNFYSIYPSEFLVSKWRTRVAAIPTWHFGGLAFGASAMLYKDWRILHGSIGVYLIVVCLSSLWVPESLRWLEVKNKTTDFDNVVKKITRINKIPPIELENCNQNILTLNNDGRDSKTKPKNYSILDLFRKGYRLNAFIYGFIWFSSMLVFYAIIYSVKAMHGNFYINLIMLYVADIPFSIIPMLIPDLIGRQKGIILFLTISSVSLLTTTGLGLWASGDIRNIGSLILLTLCKMNLSATTSCNLLIGSEIFPTVVRGKAIGYGNFMARIGGIVAPLFTANDSQDLYFYSGILGSLCLVCSILAVKLPETKGKKIKEVFDNE